MLLIERLAFRRSLKFILTKLDVSNEKYWRKNYSCRPRQLGDFVANLLKRFCGITNNHYLHRPYRKFFSRVKSSVLNMEFIFHRVWSLRPLFGAMQVREYCSPSASTNSVILQMRFFWHLCESWSIFQVKLNVAGAQHFRFLFWRHWTIRHYLLRTFSLSAVNTFRSQLSLLENVAELGAAGFFSQSLCERNTYVDKSWITLSKYSLLDIVNHK